MCSKYSLKIFWWGLDAQDREKNVQEFIDYAEDESDYLSEDEFSKIRKEYKRIDRSNVSWWKAYYAAREKFEDETKEIIRRYENNVIKETQHEWITILKEYKINKIHHTLQKCDVK